MADMQIAPKHKRLAVVRCLCLVLFFFDTTHAGPFEDGLSALKAEDYASALSLLTPLADGGDVRAQYMLSQIYGQGLGVTQDTRRAITHLTDAAEAGHAIAQFNLGNHHNNGRWVQKDAAKAAYWWRLAAGQGLPQAQYNLGTLYFYGQGVSRDPEQAGFWYRQAAEAGSKRARQALLLLEGLPTASGPVTESGNQQLEPETQTLEPVDYTGLALGIDWLLAQSADHFSLQLFASEHPDAIHRLLVSERFARQVAVFPFHRNGALWYGILYGRFDTREQAKAALKELSKQVQSGKPWVRSFGQLQEMAVR